MNQPSMRASYAKTIIGAAKVLEATQSAHVLDHIGPERRTRIRQRGMLEWMPAQEFCELAQCVYEALGEAAIPFWNHCLTLSLERRLLSPLRKAALAIHGSTPAALLRRTPEAWYLVSRGCGKCTVETPSDHQLSLIFKDLPPQMTGRAMRCLWEGGSLSCVDLLHLTGYSQSHVANATTVIVETRWHP